MSEVTLTADSALTLAKRREVGAKAIVAASGGKGYPRAHDALVLMHEEDRETYAKDVISDVLTALFGPAGTFKKASDGDGWVLYPNEFALNEARRVIEEAFRSYEGDAEDYAQATS